MISNRDRKAPLQVAISVRVDMPAISLFLKCRRCHLRLTQLHHAGSFDGVDPSNACPFVTHSHYTDRQSSEIVIPNLFFPQCLPSLNQTTRNTRPQTPTRQNLVIRVPCEKGPLSLCQERPPFPHQLANSFTQSQCTIKHPRYSAKSSPLFKPWAERRRTSQGLGCL